LSPGLIKMWISFVAIILMIVASGTIFLSRNKLKGFWRSITAVVAYFCMVIAGILMVFVVFSGPSGE
jgi:L-asparagine transporter-like permease